VPTEAPPTATRGTTTKRAASAGVAARARIMDRRATASIFFFSIFFKFFLIF
jgi:hypothetical protein